MSRCVFSIYINIEQENWDLIDSKYHKNSISKSEYSNIMFNKYYEDLLLNKKEYCQSIGVDFHFFEYDEDYIKFENKLKSISKNLTKYEIINFYKFDRLEYLSQFYDDILFLDFDVICETENNFFNFYNKKLVYICPSTEHELLLRLENLRVARFDRRAPISKRYNAALLLNKNYLDIIPYNTAVMLLNKENIKKLNYFDKFDNLINQMDFLQYNSNLTNKEKEMMGRDNETVFSYRIINNDVPIHHIDRKWHHIVSTQIDSFKDYYFGHYISKHFDYYFGDKCY